MNTQGNFVKYENGILQAHIPYGPAYTTLNLKVEHECMRKYDLSMHDLWGT